MSKFAIQDEATGEWYTNSEGNNWSKDPSQAYRYRTYGVAARNSIAINECPEGMGIYRQTARIVPAPLAEMTDAEARYWFRTQGATRFSIQPAHGNENEQYFFKDTLTMLPAPHGSNGVAYGATIEDAIRAGRKALESK